MARIEWDILPGVRGLNRGVVYLEGGSGIPWNGLVKVTNASVVTKATSRYFDGQRSTVQVTNPDAKSSLVAFTYPKELEPYIGYVGGIPGLSRSGGAKSSFSLSYTTDVVGLDGVVGQQIHILYNLVAVPSGLIRSTLDPSRNLTMFKFDLMGIPEDLNGFEPTNYVMFDARYLSDSDIITLNETLYGSDLVDAELPGMLDLIESMTQIIITNNFDGTWTAQDDSGLYITNPTTETFQITNVNAEYQDADTYDVSST